MPGIWQRLKAAAISILVVALIFISIFLFLGLEMSSPYTRESFECSVWCSMERRVLNLFGISTGTDGD